jgi:hypothetical protein
VHGACEEAHRAGEAQSSKPAEHFLCSVRERNNPQHQSENGRRGAVIRGKKFTNHVCSLLYWLLVARLQRCHNSER